MPNPFAILQGIAGEVLKPNGVALDLLGFLDQTNMDAETRRKNEERWNEAVGFQRNLMGFARNRADSLADRMPKEYAALADRADSRYRDFLGGMDKRYGQMMDQYGQQTGALSRDFRDFRGDLDKMYGQRSDRVLGRIEQMGGQERKDINQRYDELGAKTQSDLTRRGMLNTTVMPTLNRGIERERTAEMGRLEDRLRTNLTNADMAMSSERLSAAQSMKQFGTGMESGFAGNAANLRGQSNAAMSNLFNYGFGSDVGMRGATLDALGGYGSAANATYYGTGMDYVGSYLGRQDVSGVAPMMMLRNMRYRPPEPEQPSSAGAVMGGLGSITGAVSGFF